MSRARNSSSTASHADAADARAPTAPAPPIIKSRLPASIPLLPDEPAMLDQLLGSEIMKLFQEE